CPAYRASDSAPLASCPSEATHHAAAPKAAPITPPTQTPAKVRATGHGVALRGSSCSWPAISHLPHLAALCQAAPSATTHSTSSWNDAISTCTAFALTHVTRLPALHRNTSGHPSSTGPAAR